jgi:Na+/melibiose symporter-like transporter
MLLRWQPPRIRSRIERNVWYLYVDMVWAAIFMAVMAFNATYALRLGASNTMIGWLSSLPALFAMIVLMPAARLLEAQSDRGPWLRWSLLIGRGLFLLIAFVPWIVPEHAAEIMIAILIARALPMNVFSAGFNPMLADIVPARDRARVFANRNVIHSATLALCTFLLGVWLDAAYSIPWAGFPVNFQVMYLVGGVAALLSTYYVSRIRIPETGVIHRKPGVVKGKSAGSVMANVKGTLTQVWAKAGERQSFVRIVINTLVFNLGAWLVMPLYIIFFVKQLEASDSWIGLNSTLAQIGGIAGHLLWRRVIQRYGNGQTLRLAVPMAASYAFLVALFPDLTLILIWGVLINLVNPGVNLSHFNLLIEQCPPERRASYMALFSSVMNAGAFVAPMLGVALAEVVDIRWVLLVGGAIRLGGALMFHLWKVEDAADSLTGDGAN